MNKIAMFTDTHFGIQKNDEKILKYSIDYIKNIMIPHLKSNNIENVFFLGDLFDNRNLINVKVQNDLYELFTESFKDFNLYMLIGNHDTYYSNTTDTHSIKQFKNFNHIHVIENFKTVDINSYKILMVSWLTNPETLEDIINNNPCDVLLGHLDIVGFYFNKYTLCEHGIDYNIFKNKVKNVFSGHFHQQSVKVVNDTTICYIGSPWHIDRNDTEESRGYIIYDLETSNIERIENLTSPQFVNIQYPDISDIVTNNIVDVTIRYNPEQFEDDKQKYSEYIERLEQLQPFKLKIFYEAILKDEQVDIQTLTKFDFKNIKDSFYKYLQTKISNPEEITNLYDKFSFEYDKELNRT